MKVMKWSVTAGELSVIGSGLVQAVFPSGPNSAYTVDVYTCEDAFSQDAVRDATIVLTGTEFSHAYKVVGSAQMEAGLVYHVVAGNAHEVKRT